MVNAAIVVDPSTKEVISSARDQVHSCSCSINHEVTKNHDDMLLNCSATEPPKLLYDGVSCLNPWRWSSQMSCGGSCSWHPLRHAAIVAIELSSARDRHLFPGSGHRIIENDRVQQDFSCPSSKKQKTISTDVRFLPFLLL